MNESSSPVCPSCGRLQVPMTMDCPHCGAAYPQVLSTSGAVSAPPPPAPREATEINPYAAPQSAGPMSAPGTPGAGVWNAGDAILMQQGAELPDRCVRCNRPADLRLKRTLYWHNPALYLLILISLLIYLIVALIVRKRAIVHVPLCFQHESRRKRGLATLWLSLLGGMALLIAGIAVDSSTMSGAMVIVGLLGMIVGSIVGAVIAQIVVPKKITDQYLWIKKVSAEYLHTLPPAPGWIA